MQLNSLLWLKDGNVNESVIIIQVAFIQLAPTTTKTAASGFCFVCNNIGIHFKMIDYMLHAYD